MAVRRYVAHFELMKDSRECAATWLSERVPSSLADPQLIFTFELSKRARNVRRVDIDRGVLCQAAVDVGRCEWTTLCPLGMHQRPKDSRYPDGTHVYLIQCQRGHWDISRAWLVIRE